MSSVFEAMFQHPMKESMESKVDIVDFNYKVVHTAIQLCNQPVDFTDMDLEDKMALLHFFD